ncbi:Uma2 family endonuclease [uncultured Thiocystis sp.]|jgi:Uma2 family endonuclease|uniref:Uma2 family endonuclease n=1 Tax=uncultured Thiocystis sp. TaxID=1202134 RepID=UPI0025D13D89|nr:Uma2 family endonuclease [uncultured Thiocystis sp.]
MSLQPKPRPTFEDWLAAERDALDSRSEYLDGEVFAMAGASENHNQIVCNLVREISFQMKGRPCRVYASDLKVRIPAGNAGTYPDLVALCGERRFDDGRRDVLLNPSLIAEVLSPSTEAYDRGDKFALYRRIPTLQEYLLVSQQRVHVERYSREPNERWVLTEFTAMNDSVALASLDCALRLDDLYDKVEFDPPNAA